MKKLFSRILQSQVLLCGAAFAANVEVDPNALESSINGGVSASGLFANQAEGEAFTGSIAAN
jgi:hypothetical protein